MASFHIIHEPKKHTVFAGGESIRDNIHDKVFDVYKACKDCKFIQFGDFEPIDMICRDQIEYQLLLNYRMTREKSMLNESKKLFKNFTK